jgi:hypothetical protein
MGTRTVRLDEEAEKTLARLRQLTGLSISEVFKEGLIAYQAEALQRAAARPFDVYMRLDLGEGGDAVVPASHAKAGVVDAIRKKHGR